MDLWSQCGSFCSDMIYAGSQRCTMFYVPSDAGASVRQSSC